LQCFLQSALIIEVGQESFNSIFAIARSMPNLEDVSPFELHEYNQSQQSDE